VGSGVCVSTVATGRFLITFLSNINGKREGLSSIPRKVLPSPRPWDFPPSIDGDVSRADDPMELDDPE
jgi:hypothetical protein